MATRAERKAVVALHRKKGRKAAGRFLVEGTKSVVELLAAGWPVHALYATEDWRPSKLADGSVVSVTPSEMQEISSLESPQSVLAVAEIPPESNLDPARGRWLILDGVRDPGNLGTVLRLADWFGLKGLILSGDCVDWTNPKVVQASMGSLFRVPVRVRESAELLAGPAPAWCAGAFLDGENLYGTEWPEDGWLVLGNEANGIRPEVEAAIGQRLTIPRFGGAESLNVAMSAAVCCSEWRRKTNVQR